MAKLTKKNLKILLKEVLEQNEEILEEVVEEKMIELIFKKKGVLSKIIQEVASSFAHEHVLNENINYSNTQQHDLKNTMKQYTQKLLQQKNKLSNYSTIDMPDHIKQQLDKNKQSASKTTLNLEPSEYDQGQVPDSQRFRDAQNIVSENFIAHLLSLNGGK